MRPFCFGFTEVKTNEEMKEDKTEMKHADMNHADMSFPAAAHTGSRRLSGHALKLIACLSMVCDHTVKFFHFKGVLSLILSGILGRIAFPLFCFLLTEGYFHTRSWKKYVGRVLIFALISEIPFNLMYGHASFPGHQNTMFTLALGLILFRVLTAVSARPFSAVRSAVLQLSAIAGFAAAAYFLRLDYGFMGILCLACFYYFDGGMMKKRVDACFWGCLSLNLNLFGDAGAFLSMIPVAMYSGRRGGTGSRTEQIGFYLFYPAHLAVLALLAGLIRTT